MKILTKERKHNLLNSKTEYNRCIMPEITMTNQRKERQTTLAVDSDNNKDKEDRVKDGDEESKEISLQSRIELRQIKMMKDARQMIDEEKEEKGKGVRN